MVPYLGSGDVVTRHHAHHDTRNLALLHGKMHIRPKRILDTLDISRAHEGTTRRRVSCEKIGIGRLHTRDGHVDGRNALLDSQAVIAVLIHYRTGPWCGIRKPFFST